MKNDVDMFTKAVFRYDHAVASFQVGLGVKTEGSMTIAGTKGYVYVRPHGGRPTTLKLDTKTKIKIRSTSIHMLTKAYAMK